MAATAVSPQARPATRTVPVQAPAPPLTNPSMRRTRTGPMRKGAADGILRVARDIAMTHPEMQVHRHLEDAAGQLRLGNDDGALRHLRTAAAGLQPAALRRHGIHDDAGHLIARRALDRVTLHMDEVGDIRDAEAHNQALIARDSYGDDRTAPGRNPGQRDPGALAQKPAVRQPPGNQALNAPARNNAGRADPNVASPNSPQRRGSRQFARSWDEVLAVTELAPRRHWGDVLADIELSARTPYLSVTPAPYGEPGGPGLYRLENNRHAAYFEQVVQALMHKRGMDKAQASAVAWAALRRWQAKSRHPEVKEAASRGLRQEAEAAARARAAHGHANTWDELCGAIELAVVNVRTYQRTVNTPNGPVTQTITQHPQNYKNGMGQPAPSGQQGAPGQWQQMPSQAAEKQRLIATAKQYQQHAALLGVEETAFNSALMNALYGSNTTQAQQGATTGAQKGATTGAQTGSTTQSTTAAATAAQQASTTAQVPATGATGTNAAGSAAGGAGTTPTGTTAAQAGATTGAQKGATTGAQAGSTTKAAPSTPSAAQQAVTAALAAGVPQAQVTQAQQQAAAAAQGMTVPQLRTAIGQLQLRINWYTTHADQMTAQAAKL